MTRVATLFIYGLGIVILLMSGFSVALSAQTGSIRLEGIVWDPSGNALPGAVLTAVEESTRRQSDSVSDSDGHYIFLSLQPGVYTVTAKSKGFKDVTHRSISLFKPGTVSENFSFEVSAIDKESSTGEMPRLAESESSGWFSRKQIEALPLQDRNSLSLLIFQPGVGIQGGNPGQSAINGTRPAMNSIVLDGVTVTAQVEPQLDLSLLAINPDSISDMQIITSNAKAEYGRSGGAQFTVTSRQGSKTWSKELYDYSTNKYVDANDFFNNASRISKPEFTRNIFGGSISGPAFGQKNLLFLNIEGNRTDDEIIENRLVLTPEAKSGVFRWYTPGTFNVNSYDIVANDPRKLGIDPTIAATIVKLPDPNNLNIGDYLNTAGYRFNDPAYLNEQVVNLRLDRSVSANHELFFRFNWNRIDETDVADGAIASFPGQQSGIYLANNLGFVAGSNLVLSPKTVNELRVGYIRPDVDLQRPARLSTPMLLNNSWTNPVDPSFPSSSKSPIIEISDSLTHARTLHTFKYGLNYRRTVQSSVDYSGVYPDVTFGNNNGNVPSVGPTGVSVISSGYRDSFENLYNDLLGRIESVSQTFNSSLTSPLPAGTAKTRSFLFQELAGFVQDDWRVRSNLTLNLGLRYEISTTPKEENGYQSVLDQAARISSSANISDFKFVQGSSWYSKDLKDFAPRAGFAWDPFGSETMVIRGAYGIYYDRLIGAVTNFVDANSYGFSQTVSLYPNATGSDVRLSDGIPLPAQPSAPLLQPLDNRSASIAVMNPNLRTPRVDQFNLTVEKRLFGAVLEAGYVGTRGRRLFQYVNLNQTKTNGDFLQAFEDLQAYRASGTPVPASNTLLRIFGSPLAALNALGGYVVDTGQVGLAADTVDQYYYSRYAAAGLSDYYLRNFPQFNQFLYGSNSAQSWYHSLQLGLHKSAKNYNLRAYFTWSKSLDTASADGSSFVSPSDSFNPESDKAPSDFDRTRVLNLAFNYALPFGRNLSRESETPKWVNTFFGGWNVGLLYVKESGARFSVNSGIENQYAGVIGLADYSGNRNIGSIAHSNGAIYWFNPKQAEQFTYPEAGEDPTSGRNSFTGPSYADLDAVLQKKFTVRENKSLQLRVEAYNVLNSTHFSIPDATLSDPNFGVINSTQGNSRRMQVALRYQF